MRLQEQRGVIDRVSHRDGQLHLPVFGAGRDDFVEYLRQLRHRQRIDLGIDAGLDADVAYVLDGADRLIVAARHSPDEIVQIAQAVDRDADRAHPCGIGRRDPLLGQAPGAGLHAAVNAKPGDFRGDLQPVAAQIGLAADQRDFPGSGGRELANDVDAFGRRQFVRAPLSGPRSAVTAFQVAGERDFPDDMDRHVGTPVLHRPHALGRRPLLIAHFRDRHRRVTRTRASFLFLFSRLLGQALLARLDLFFQLAQRALEIALRLQQRLGVIAQHLEIFEFGSRISPGPY